MNTDEIKILLEKYYEAETTKEEEALLFEALKATTREQFAADRGMAMFIEAEKQVTFSGSVSPALLEDSEKAGAPVYKMRPFTWISRSVAVAAAVLLLFGVVYQFNNPKVYELPNTTNDPIIAYQETKTALYTVSYKLNHSMARLNKLEKINKAFEKLEGLDKLEKYGNKLSTL